MKKFKGISLLFALVLVLGLIFTGCSKKEAETVEETPVEEAAPAETETEEEEAAPEETAEETELQEIVVAATPEPHATILNSEAVKASLEADGFTIKVVEYTDYVQPNLATEDGSVDANFFQHTPYLEQFNEENGTSLVNVGEVHFEPLGIYPGKAASIDEIADGATIAVPNDTSNEARALLLLEKAGLIKLTEGVGLEATVKDIVENPKNLEIKEIEAVQTAKVLPDVDVAVINGNYALAEGLSASEDGLLVEDDTSEVANTYPNIIVVKAGNEETEATKALVKAVTTAEVKAFIEENWQGAVVPLF